MYEYLYKMIFAIHIQGAQGAHYYIYAFMSIACTCSCINRRQTCTHTHKPRKRERINPFSNVNAFIWQLLAMKWSPVCMSIWPSVCHTVAFIHSIMDDVDAAAVAVDAVMRYMILLSFELR